MRGEPPTGGIPSLSRLTEDGTGEDRKGRDRIGPEWNGKDRRHAHAGLYGASLGPVTKAHRGVEWTGSEGKGVEGSGEDRRG